MAASHNPNHNNDSNFEPFLAVAVSKYISDEDHILSFKIGQEMLITGEVAREAGQFWYKGKVDLGEDEDKFIHKASVVKKIPMVVAKGTGLNF